MKNTSSGYNAITVTTTSVSSRRTYDPMIIEYKNSSYYINRNSKKIPAKFRKSIKNLGAFFIAEKWLKNKQELQNSFLIESSTLLEIAKIVHNYTLDQNLDLLWVGKHQNKPICAMALPNQEGVVFGYYDEGTIELLENIVLEDIFN